MLLIKLSELPQRKLAKIGEENPSLLLHLVLHVDHLLLSWGDAQGVQAKYQVLKYSFIKTGWIILARLPLVNFY